MQRGKGNPLPAPALYLNSSFAIDGSIQLPKPANRYAKRCRAAVTEPGAVATALNLRKRLRYGPKLVAYNKGFASDISLFGSWKN
jgi:hypothetical protein